MGYVFPAMPSYDPAGPDVDGFANIRFTSKGMVLELAEGEQLLIPCITIHKGSMVIKPGGDKMVNTVQIEFLAGEVTVEDDSYPDEFKVQYPLVEHVRADA